MIPVRLRYKRCLILLLLDGLAGRRQNLIDDLLLRFEFFLAYLLCRQLIKDPHIVL